MAGAPSGRTTDKTPYIIYALAAAQAAIGVYYGSNNETAKAVAEIRERVARIEAVVQERREASEREDRRREERREGR